MENTKMLSMTTKHLKKQHAKLLELCNLFSKLSQHSVTHECKSDLLKIMQKFGAIIHQNQSFSQILEVCTSMNLANHQNEKMQLQPIALTNGATPNTSELIGAMQTALSSDKDVTLQMHSQSGNDSLRFMLQTNHSPQSSPSDMQDNPFFDHSIASSSSHHTILDKEPSASSNKIEFGDVSAAECQALESKDAQHSKPRFLHSVSDNHLQTQHPQQQNDIKERRKTESDITLTPIKQQQNNLLEKTSPQCRVSVQCMRNTFKNFINSNLPYTNSWFRFVRFGLELSDQDISHVEEENKTDSFAKKFSFLEKWAEGKNFQSKEELEQQLNKAAERSVEK